MSVVALTLAVGSAGADPGDIGYEGPSHTGAASEVTGEKPESKLWWNDGFWWASMYSPTAAKYKIFKLDLSTQTWVETATVLDARPKSKADVMWDATAKKLYVASHDFAPTAGSTQASRLYRYSYNVSTDTYTKDSGFPVNIVANFSGEALVIDKDSTGQLWATWRQNGQIMVNRTVCSATPCVLADDKVWGTPFVPDVNSVNPDATTVSDDISSVVRFGGDKIGLIWTNHLKEAIYFAVHNDADADEVWQPAVAALSGPGAADDHANLKSMQSADGRVFAVVKTSMNSSAPRIMVLVRATDGTWTTYQHSSGQYGLTRPILMIDETNNLLHVFASDESGGQIYKKSTPIDAISFTDGKGDVVMSDASSFELDNATSTKQRVNSTTGLAVLASNNITKRYWHYYDTLTGVPVNLAPTAGNDAYTTPQGTPLAVPAPGVLANDTDPDADPITAVKVTDPGHGTLALNADGSLTYTPAPSFWGTDTFTYRASDGHANSAVATVSITVTQVGPSGTPFTPVADTYVRSNFPTEANGASGTLRVYKSGTKETRSLLRFNVTGVSGTPAWAKLRLFVTNTSPAGGAVHEVANDTWSESAVTWNTAPPIGTLWGNIGNAAPANTWVEVDLTGAVTANGLHSFALAGVSGDIAYYTSREGTNKPQLVIGPPAGPINASPVAANDAYAMAQGTTLNVAAPGVLGNDTDAESNPLTAAKLSDPASGTLTFNADGSFSYTPAPAFTGNATFTYRANDGTSNSNTATVTIAVNAGPPPPTGVTPVADAFVRSAAPTENNGSAPTINVARDGSGETWAYLKFTVSGLTAAPSSVKLRLFVKDAGGVGATVRRVADTSWSEGSLTWNNAPPGVATLGTIGGAPLNTWVELDVTSTVTGNGTYSFVLTDGSGDVIAYASREATEKPLLVIDGGGSGGGGGNTAPVAVNDAYAMAQGTTLNVAAPGVLGNDTDADSNPLTATKLSNPANGTLTFNANGSFTYTPSVVFSGNVTFTYRASDGTANSNTATVTITVNASGGGGPGTVTAVADAFVRSAAPTENNGSALTLEVMRGGSETWAYLKFTVSGLSAAPSSVKLRLFVKDTSGVAATVRRVSDTTWSEGSLTWNNAPPGVATLGTIGAPALNTWVELDVTSTVTGNGTYSFVLTDGSSDLIAYASREAAEKPQLVITA